MGHRYNGRAVFVGNLPDDIREKELEDIFYKFGRIRTIDLKNPPRPPPFAFVEFEDSRDAEEAASRRNGYEFHGFRLRVEIARGGNSSAPVASEYRPPRNSQGYRVLVRDLPKSASWQDLKDHFRRYVTPMYTDIIRERDGGITGVVEFESHDDMRLAIRKLDRSEFKNPFGSSEIRLIDDSRGGGKSRSRSPSRGRGRRSPSYSRSRSRSPARGRSRSASASRSRSDDSRSP